jgi:hypothetical protein
MTAPPGTRTVVLAVLTLAAAVSFWATHMWDDGDRPEQPIANTSPATVAAEGTARMTTTVRVRSDGVLRVHQSIRATEPMTGIVLLAPVDPYFQAGTVTATHVRVEASGVPASGRDRVTLKSAAFAFPESRSIQLRYLLSGALERSSASNRALARVTSLDLVSNPEVRPTTYTFSGAHILNLACTPIASAALPVPCGAQEGRAWVLRLDRPTADRYHVMVQLDLSPRTAAHGAGPPRSS